MVIVGADNDPWQWWLMRLAGEPMQMNESNPHAGFYRWRQRERYLGKHAFTPVAYWPGENGELNCRVGDSNVTPQRGRDIWIYVGNNPVTEEAYRAVAERGERWEDEHEAVPMGHNQPPEDNSFEGLRDAVANLAREAELRIEGPPVADQSEADRLANLADRLAELHNKISDAKAAERQPHDRALKAIQTKWAPLLAAAETYKNIKYKLLTPWFRKQEQEAKQRAEEAAASGAEAETQPRRPRAGTRGRAMSLKSKKSAEIIDFGACLEFFKGHDDIHKAVQALANRAVRAGVTVPGTKVIEEQQVV
jgi:hypothetical protein